MTDDEYANTSKSSRQCEDRTGYESVLSAGQQDGNGPTQEDGPSTGGEQGNVQQSAGETTEDTEQKKATWYETYM